MILELPTGFSADVSLLESSSFGEDAHQSFDRLQTQGYVLGLGLTPAHAEAINAMAHQDSIREYCPKDLTERFASHDATQTWLEKRRAVFLLLKRESDGSLRMAGYAWAGMATSSHVPGGAATFALRIGEADQGRGLAMPFARLVMAAAVKLFGMYDIWLEAWQSNQGAVHIYRKLGFEIVAEQTGERPTAAGGSVVDTRLFMSLKKNG